LLIKTLPIAKPGAVTIERHFSLLAKPGGWITMDVRLSQPHGLKVHALRVLILDNTNGAAEESAPQPLLELRTST